MNELEAMYEVMRSCNACSLRAGCSQVVTHAGNTENPILMIVGEAPGADEDIEGQPFVGRAGQILREALRETKILNKSNTLICNVLGCRPPKNKFPTDESPSICAEKWLFKAIGMAKPKRMLLLGAKPLWHVAGLKGITDARGQWMNVRGVRTMATFHPSYVMRNDSEGKMHVRNTFEADLREVAYEVKETYNAIHRS